MSRKIKVNSDQRPFVMVYWDFIESSLFDWNEKRIFIVLKKFANEKNQCFPSIKTLCDLSQLSRNTVKKALKSLREKKVISIEHRRDKENNRSQSHLYTLYDYKELWKAESIEQIKETIDVEELQLFELAKKKGYILTKEKEPVSDGSQTTDTSTYQNNLHNDTTNKPESQELYSTSKADTNEPESQELYSTSKTDADAPKSQESYSMSKANADEPESQEQDSMSKDGTDATFDRLREQYLAIKGEKCNDSIDEPESQEPHTSKTSTDKPKSQEPDSASEADADALLDRLWELYPVKKGKGRISAAQKKKLLKIGYDEMARAIERYKQYVESVDYLHYQYGSTFFTGGYVDYLDANYDPESDRKAKGNPETKNKQKKNRFNDYPTREYDFAEIKRTMFLQ